eukprot:CAMPEP_0184499252 /NCGR_PEP_ID=MMETSP0113_2-20130426/40995_1 /TAXON_ID=91329 /ORGANISM="Norrisiella sphaerica, Strain BC52" /LENGTH=753 /DNA_ID=CAMNT_0026887093 /DNA_START=75 /DNA_END=2336 /DNA_ORIENTATION=+
MGAEFGAKARFVGIGAGSSNVLGAPSTCRGQRSSSIRGRMSRLRGGLVFSKVYSCEPPAPGESRIHMCSHIEGCDHSSSGTVDQPFDDETLSSLWDIFTSGLRRSPDGPCLKYRQSIQPLGPYISKTYRQVEVEALTLARSLKIMGVQKGHRVGIYAKNMAQWTIAQLACASQGYVVVPIYETIGPDAMSHVINHSGSKVVFASTDNVQKLLESRSKCPQLQHIIVMDNPVPTSNATPKSKQLESSGTTAAAASSAELIKNNTDPERKAAASAAIHVHRWDEVTRSSGASMEILEDPPISPSAYEAAAMIMYTSGTTGPPKGVVISNRAIVASVASISRFLDKVGYKVGPGWCTISYLPLAHVFEQTAEALFLARGAAIGYYSGHIKGLPDDLEDLKPDVFLGVPQVYARFVDKIVMKVRRSGCIRRFLFDQAFQAQTQAMRRGERSRLWDFLVFNKIKRKLFPKVKVFISGAAPLSADTQEFLETMFGSPLLQGYGLTETCAGITVQFPRSGYSSCGAVLCGCLVKVRDVAEMNYTSNPAIGIEQGEILVKGPLLASGYYRDPDKTKECWDADGWFATGDIGRFNADGSLSVIDRKKSMFKLAQGEYVSPENVEAVLIKSPWIRQVWVHGESSERYIVCVAVPDRRYVKEWALKHGMSALRFQDICKDPRLNQEILSNLKLEVDKSSLPAFHKPVGVTLETDIDTMEQGFTLEKGMLTPTMKYKRPVMQRVYAKDIERMYLEAKQDKSRQKR